MLQPKLQLTENKELMDSSFASMFILDMAGSPSLPALKNFGELPGIMNRALDRILLEGADVQESLDSANAELTELLKNE